MGRFLFFMALIIFVVWQLKRIFKSKQAKAEPRQKNELMVSCQHCGLNIPESESFTARGVYYCSAQHLQEGTRSDGV